VSVMPGSFVQQTPDTFISRFCYRAFFLFVPAGVFRRRQPQVAHQMPWRLEASELEYLSYNRDGGKSIDTVETTQEADDLFIFL